MQEKFKRLLSKISYQYIDYMYKVDKNGGNVTKFVQEKNDELKITVYV